MRVILNKVIWYELLRECADVLEDCETLILLQINIASPKCSGLGNKNLKEIEAIVVDIEYCPMGVRSIPLSAIKQSI